MSLTRNQYDNLMRSYDDKRLKNKKLLTSRFEEIYKCIPEIKGIDNDIAHNSINLTKQSLNQNNPELIGSLKSINRALIDKKHKLLVDNGYLENYLEPIYDCPLCKDTGYINDKHCNCFNQLVVNSLYSQSRIQRFLSEENFDTFNFHYYSNELDDSHTVSSYDNIKNVVKSCKLSVEHFGSKRDSLLFTGPTGVGKTFLTRCIAKELLDSGHTVLYLTSTQLIDKILPEMTKKHVFKPTLDEDLLNYVFDCELLIIDDLGSEYTNSFTISQLYLCLNERLLRNNATVISTNLSLNEIRQRYTERIFSRIVDKFKIFSIYGSDIRYKRREERINRNL